MEQMAFLEVEAVDTGYRVADLPARERPVHRIREAGPRAVSNVELLACLLQTGDALKLAEDVLVAMGGVEGLA